MAAVSDVYDVDYFIDISEEGNRFGVLKEASFKALSNFKIDFKL